MVVVVIPSPQSVSRHAHNVCAIRSADFHSLLWVRHPFVGSVPAWHATRLLPFLSTAASPHLARLAHHQQRAGWLQVLTAAAAFDLALWHWDNVVWETVRLPRPRHAVRGLMRSYVTRLSGGLSPRALLVQLQYWCFRRDVIGLPAKR